MITYSTILTRIPSIIKVYGTKGISQPLILRWEIQLQTVRLQVSSPNFESWVLSGKLRIKEVFSRMAL